MFLWIVTTPNGDRFTTDAFIQKDNRIRNGMRNPNLITAISTKKEGYFTHDRAYIFLSSIRHRDSIQLFVFDITGIDSHNVKYVYTNVYKSEYFAEGSFTVEDFNLRGMTAYERFTNEPQPYSNPFYINIIVSCINNHLLFIQYKEDVPKDPEDPEYEGENLEYSMRVTSRAAFPGIGRIFTERSFRNVDVDFNFFLTSDAPPLVYEWNIDEKRNARNYRTFGYDAFNLTTHRYRGLDSVSVNKNYIAHLLFDTHEFRQVLRIYDRGETNFASGHTHVILDQFTTQVNAFTWLRYSGWNYIFVRNSHRWEAFEVHQNYLVVDTHQYKDEFMGLVNRTFELNVIAKNEVTDEAALCFNIQFTMLNDMNIYLVTLDQYSALDHAYGDSYFSHTLDPLYSGPNKHFGILPTTPGPLRPENQFRVQNYMNSIIRQLREDSNCTNSVFSRWRNQLNGRESVSFFCIGGSTIEKHEFDGETMEQIDFTTDTFPFANFIDFYVHKSPIARGRRLRILSKENSNDWTPAYFIHDFLFTRNMLRWRRKTQMHIEGYTLRYHNPLINIGFGYGFNALIDESEHNVIFTSIRSKNLKTVVQSNNRVMEVHTCCTDNLFFSHYDKDYVSSYRFFYHYNAVEDTQDIALEFVKYYRFTNIYRAFDVDHSGRAVLFSGQNKIDLYRVVSEYEFDFVRTFPMFGFVRFAEFVDQEESGLPIFQLLGNSLYVLMQHSQRRGDRKIFIYNLETSSHNSLMNMVDVDEQFKEYSLSLTSEVIRGFDTVMIYLFYNGTIFQYIEYQPNNLLVPVMNQDEIIVDPKDKESFQRLETPFQVFPLRTHFSQTVNHTHQVNITSRNIGLIAKQRTKNGVINSIHNAFPVMLSLLDHFDGFNLSYRLSNISGGTEDFSFALSGENLETYLLDAVNTEQEVLYSFQYMINDVPHLIVIYTQEYLMEIFKLENGIEKIEEDHHYNRYFGEENIVFANYQYIEEMNCSFLLLSTQENSNHIGPKYPIKLFRFFIDENYTVRTRLLLRFPHNMRLTRAIIDSSPLQSADFTFIFQSDYTFESDSMLTFSSLE